MQTHRYFDKLPCPRFLYYYFTVKVVVHDTNKPSGERLKCAGNRWRARRYVLKGTAVAWGVKATSHSAWPLPSPSEASRLSDATVAVVFELFVPFFSTRFLFVLRPVCVCCFGAFNLLDLHTWSISSTFMNERQFFELQLASLFW